MMMESQFQHLEASFFFFFFFFKSNDPTIKQLFVIFRIETNGTLTGSFFYLFNYNLVFISVLYEENEKGSL